MTTPAKRGPGRPPLSDEGRARLVAYVAPSTKAEVEAHAERLGVSAGDLVREAIDAHLPRVRRGGVMDERDGTLTVHGVPLVLARDHNGVRVWRGKDPDLGTIRVERVEGLMGRTHWIARRVCTYSRTGSVGRDDERRARSHIEVSGSGPDLAAALRALHDAELMIGDQRLAACIARRAWDAHPLSASAATE